MIKIIVMDLIFVAITCPKIVKFSISGPLNSHN